MKHLLDQNVDASRGILLPLWHHIHPYWKVPI
jgi:hypothetical protein